MSDLRILPRLVCLHIAQYSQLQTGGTCGTGEMSKVENRLFWLVISERSSSHSSLGILRRPRLRRGQIAIRYSEESLLASRVEAVCLR
jgi:hypothetical protein